MAPMEECEHETIVMIRWDLDGLAVPLSQLSIQNADDETVEATEDWHYWSGRRIMSDDVGLSATPMERV